MMMPDEPTTGTTALADERVGEDLPRKRLGDFRILRRIGEGGMGIVHLARQESLNRLVALKIIRPEFSGSVAATVRFAREARTIAKLRHPNIVTVYAVGESGGVRYIAMELVPGKALSEILEAAAAKGESIPPRTALRWIADLARALDYAHDQGIIHRDVKPSNIRITPDDRPLLVDFGMAREVGGPGVTLTGELIGSPHYVAPEQVASRKGTLDGRTDVYALGVVLYQCLTGRVPFNDDSLERVLHCIVTEDPPRPRSIAPSIPRDAEVVTLKALEKEPSHRYPNAGALADDLEAILAFRPIRARPPGPVASVAKWARRNRAAAAAAAAVVVAAVALGGTLGWQASTRAETRRAEARRTLSMAVERVGEYRRLSESIAQAEPVGRVLRDQADHGDLTLQEYDALDLHESVGQVALAERRRLLREIGQALRTARRLDPDIAIAPDILAVLSPDDAAPARAVAPGSRRGGIVETSPQLMLDDDFDDGVLDPAWVVEVDDTVETWAGREAGTDFVVTELTAAVPDAYVTLRRRTPPLGDFKAQFTVAWDSEGSIRATQILVLRVATDNAAVEFGYFDRSDTTGGAIHCRVGGPATFLAVNTLFSERVVVTIERTGSEVTVRWGAEVVETGTFDPLIDQIVIRFGRGAVATRSFFGSLSLDRVVLEGTPQTQATGDLDATVDPEQRDGA